MKKIWIAVIFLSLFIAACGISTTSKKRNLDDTLFKYASMIRWSDYDNALRLLHPNGKNKPSNFELQKLKQFKVSSYSESPIIPGNKPSEILQKVEIQLYNIHTNKSKTILDQQSWEYDENLSQWFITSGLPKL